MKGKWYSVFETVSTPVDAKTGKSITKASAITPHLSAACVLRCDAGGDHVVDRSPWSSAFPKGMGAGEVADRRPAFGDRIGVRAGAQVCPSRTQHLSTSENPRPRQSR